MHLYVLENCGAKCMYECLCLYWEDINLLCVLEDKDWKIFALSLGRKGTLCLLK